MANEFDEYRLNEAEIREIVRKAFAAGFESSHCSNNGEFGMGVSEAQAEMCADGIIEDLE